MRIVATKQLPLAKLKTFPGNPRRGDVEAIKESLERNGQWRAIVVREDTMEVLAGNHTTMAMRELGWPKALAHLVQVSDSEARRIVAGDNRLADRGGYDAEDLSALLGTIAQDDGLAGTGWSDEDLAKLLSEPDPAPVELADSYEVVIEVDSEQEQTELLERFTAEGMRCRALL